MRFLLKLLLILIIAVVLALFARDDPGFVLVGHGDWMLETSLSLVVVLTVLGFLIVYLSLRFLINAWGLPRRLGQWRRRRSVAKVRKSTHRGLLALAAGHWAKAERYLTRNIEYSEVPLLNYLGATRAAQKLGAELRRDHYLAEAHQSMPEAKLAVGLTQAEVQIHQGQYEQALASLLHLQAAAPKHGQVLHMLKRVYEELESWGDLRELLPALRRHKVLVNDALDALERKVHFQLLQIAIGGKRLDNLRGSWQHLPASLQHEIEFILPYARRLACLGAGSESEQVIREALKRHWEPELAQLYGQVEGADSVKQLEHAEAWLKKYPKQAELLLTLGRLCLHNQLWGKARSYLEASYGVDATAETCLVLGSLLEQLGENEAAQQHYRRGLEQATGICPRIKIEQADG